MTIITIFNTLILEEILFHLVLLYHKSHYWFD